MRTVRLLKNKERALLIALVMDHPHATKFVESLDRAFVEEMADGGMGSLRFYYFGQKSRSFSKKLIEREFIDSDGIPVFVVVNVDECGDIYELDMWKVDFSSLKRFPRAEENRGDN
ncbi:DUF6984 family protein [Achromobacter xylosoxidans]